MLLRQLATQSSRTIFAFLGFVVAVGVLSSPAPSQVTFVANPGQDQAWRQEMGNLAVSRCASEIEARRQFLLSIGFSPRDSDLTDGIFEVLNYGNRDQLQDLNLLKRNLQGYQEMYPEQVSRNPENATRLQVGMCTYRVLISRAEGKTSKGGSSLTAANSPPTKPSNEPYVLRPAATRSFQVLVRGPDQKLGYHPEARKLIASEYNRLCRAQLVAALGPNMAGAGEIMSSFFHQGLTRGPSGLKAELAKFDGRSQPERDMARCLAEVSLGITSQQVVPPATNQAAATTPNTDATRKGTVIAGNGQSAMHCASIVTIANGDPKSVAGGGRIIQNNCGQTIEIAWCYVDKECGVSSGAVWSVGAGKSWPVSAEREVRWAACLGANTVRFVDGTAGTRFICNAPRGGPQPKAQPGPPLKSGS